MYTRNYLPLFIVASIALLVSIVWLGSLAREQSAEYSIAGSQTPYPPVGAPTDEQKKSAPKSADPLVTPGPSRSY